MLKLPLTHSNIPIHCTNLYMSFINCLSHSSGLNFICEYNTCLLLYKASHLHMRSYIFPDIFTFFYWHIPWPSWKTYSRYLPAQCIPPPSNVRFWPVCAPEINVNAFYYFNYLRVRLHSTHVKAYLPKHLHFLTYNNNIVYYNHLNFFIYNYFQNFEFINIIM